MYVRKDEKAMKKFLKFLFCTFSLAAAALGVYYLVKNVINKNDADDDFDDFEDDFEDDFDEFETEKDGNASESREYVPINLSGADDEAQEETPRHYEAEEATEAHETEDDNVSDEE